MEVDFLRSFCLVALVRRGTERTVQLVRRGV